jgi:hypothetical protein
MAEVPVRAAPPDRPSPLRVARHRSAGRRAGRGRPPLPLRASRWRSSSASRRRLPRFQTELDQRHQGLVPLAACLPPAARSRRKIRRAASTSPARQEAKQNARQFFVLGEDRPSRAARPRPLRDGRASPEDLQSAIMQGRLPDRPERPPVTQAPPPCRPSRIKPSITRRCRSRLSGSSAEAPWPGRRRSAGASSSASTASR